ncbi:MAG: prolyl oligopeptidase family serine peptidase [Planctomycetota bacterium]|nr:prolyl oligopeptidase family serine peptidase [Planctomycetota bacterium]
MHSRFLSVFLVLMMVGMARAGTDEKKWTVDDIIKAQNAGSWTISRDGSIAAWTKSTIEKIKGVERRVSHLWLTRLESNESIQLTRGDDSARSPQFSPDGTKIAFITSRLRPSSGGGGSGGGVSGGGDSGGGGGDVASSQIWIMPIRGGEAWPSTKLKRGIQSYAWADDDTFIISAQETPTLWEKQIDKKKDTAIVVEDAQREPPVRLFKVGLKGGKLERLTNNDDWIGSMRVSPDGMWAVLSVEQSLSFGFDERIPPIVRLVNLESGDSTRLYEDVEGRFVPRSFQWRPDSTGYYFVNRHSTHPIYRSASIGELYYHDLESGEHEKVNLSWDRGLSGGYKALNDGAIVMLANGVTNLPARLTRTQKTWHRQTLEGTHVPYLGSFTVSDDGKTIIYSHSTATMPTQHYVAKLNAHHIVGERQITNLNPGYEGKPTGRVEVITWKGADDNTIEGIVSYPLDYEEGKQYPLLLNPHGGPAGTSRDSWSMSYGSPRILWRQKGAFVLEVNYHGSAGYGLAFVESIGNGKYYELERIDLNNGVDHLIELGLVDPDRLGVVGWSNGGILGADLITQSTRWKVASIGAADVEWISDWANVDFGAGFDNYYFGATPLEDPQLYIDKSPFFKLDKVTTPTIIYTGTEDRNVPPHQSWSLFRMLQHLEKAPARLVLFPGEPHGLRKIVHRRRKMAEDEAWFDTYLFQDQDEENDAIKKGSRLEALLARGEAARQGDQYGITINAILVPEVVERGELQVGRFEITRAQYAAYMNDFDVEPGTGNFPVTAVSFDEAQAYVGWLAQHTGLAYRLPTCSEAEGMSGTGGNTLDAWAGYSPNPEDAARLGEALDLVSGFAPLLREVGLGIGDGDPDVFDLDGNASEWAIADDQSGVLIGPSADRPGSKLQRSTEAGEAYRGFRVVIGEIVRDSEVEH